MGRKPPYSEVKQRGENLEREAAVRKHVKDALRDSEERYRNLVESARDVIYTLSEEGTFTSLNPAFESNTGWSRSEWIGKPLQSIIHPDDWPGALEFLELILRGETPPIHEARVRVSSGEYLVVESMVTPRFQGGKLVGVLGVARNITQRKRVEEALRESEEKYRDLVENISDVIYAVDNNGVMTYISPAIESFMGYGPAEIIGRPFTEFIYEEDLPRMKKRFNEVISGNLKESEYRVLNKSGEIRWICPSSKPTVVKDRVIGLQGVLTDITERKRAEESLQESEARYRELADSIADVFFAMDKELRYTYWNKASENLTGISAKEAIGKSLLEVFPDTPQTRKAEKLYLDVLRTQRSQSLVHEYQLRGKHFLFEISAYPSSHGVSVFVKDVTERKHLEEALRESEGHLRSLMESASNFAVYRLALERENPHQPSVVFVSPSIMDILGISDPMQFETWFENIHPDDAERLTQTNSQAFTTSKLDETVRIDHPQKKEWRYIQVIWTSIPNHEGQPNYANGILLDVTERIRAEKELEINSHNLEEANIALKVLLQRRDKDKAELEEKVLSNVKELIEPYIEKLKTSGLDQRQKAYAEILQSNLNDITSHFSRKFSFRHLNLTPMEIQIANLVKLGKTNKEIAALLHSSLRTIAFHRENIRKKLDLKNKKVNLQAYLRSLS